MSTSHYVLKCHKCDVILAQCKCPFHDKIINYTICADCDRPDPVEVLRRAGHKFPQQIVDQLKSAGYLND